MGLAGNTLNTIIESQIFFPDRTVLATPDHVQLPYEDAWIETADGFQIHGWHVPHPDPTGLMVFSHGNAGNISHRLDNVKRLHDIGLSVLIYDYRGYGRSQGTISEQGLYLDAEAAYGFAGRAAARDGLKLIVFGRSLGGVAAVHMAATGDCAGVILESTFSNLGDMARIHFPLPLIHKQLTHHFDSISKIQHVTTPLLFFHGDRDTIVPIELGRKLFEAAAQPKEFVTLRGAGHNDTYLVQESLYFDKIAAFVQEGR
jgi:hypothetical protein